MRLSLYSISRREKVRADALCAYETFSGLMELILAPPFL